MIPILIGGAILAGLFVAYNWEDVKKWARKVYANLKEFARTYKPHLQKIVEFIAQECYENGNLVVKIISKVLMRNEYGQVKELPYERPIETEIAMEKLPEDVRNDIKEFGQAKIPAGALVL